MQKRHLQDPSLNVSSKGMLRLANDASSRCCRFCEVELMTMCEELDDGNTTPVSHLPSICAISAAELELYWAMSRKTRTKRNRMTINEINTKSRSVCSPGLQRSIQIAIKFSDEEYQSKLKPPGTKPVQWDKDDKNLGGEVQDKVKLDEQPPHMPGNFKATCRCHRGNCYRARTPAHKAKRRRRDQAEVARPKIWPAGSGAPAKVTAHIGSGGKCFLALVRCSQTFRERDIYICIYIYVYIYICIYMYIYVYIYIYTDYKITIF